MNRPKVWVLTLTYKGEPSVSVHVTHEAAWEVLRNYVGFNWQSWFDDDTELPADLDQAVGLYFERAANDEFFDLEAHEILGGDPASVWMLLAAQTQPTEGDTHASTE